MTKIAQRLIGRVYGRDPEITDPVRGEALVIRSVASLPRQRVNLRAGTFGSWAAKIPMIVRLPGQEPYEAAPVRWMTREKFPVGGTTLPVTVQAGDDEAIRIEWDEVPTIDEQIAAGAPVFTDPESVQRTLAEELSKLRHVEGSAPVRPAREPEGPHATILAVGWRASDEDGSAQKLAGELLLSVAVPGEPRRGARVSGSLPVGAMLVDWAEIPVDIGRGGKVKPNWKGTASAGDLLAALAGKEPGTKMSLREQFAASRDLKRQLKSPQAHSDPRVAVWQQRTARLLQAGVDAPAILRQVRVGELDQALGGYVVEVGLTVRPGGADSYEVRVEQLLGSTLAQALSDGDEVVVRVSGEDPQDVMLWHIPAAEAAPGP